MKQPKLILTLVFVMGFGLFALKAQHSVNTTGGNASNANGSVSYSIGQIVYSVYSNVDGAISEGVQQPYEIFIITSLEEFESIDLTLKVFPNPVDDRLHLEISGQDLHQLSDLQYQLLDVNGKLLKKERLIDHTALIEMGSKQPGAYFLIVTASDERIGLFRIIKR